MKTRHLLSLLVCTMLSTLAFAQWTVESPISGFFRIDAVYFTDSTTGFVGGTNALFDGDGLIAKTTNGGGSWTTVSTIDTCSVNDICFVNANLGFAVGKNGLIAKTIDGGANWNVQLFEDTAGFKEPLTAVYFVDQNIGYAVGGFNAQWALKTTDGGDNWTQLPLPSYVFQRMHSVYFTSADTGYAVGGDQFSGGQGRIYYTENGGSTWDTLSSGVASYFDDVYFTAPDTGFIGGWEGLLLKTTDAGQSWVQQDNQDPDEDEVRAFDFVNGQLGYACTLGGKILKTTDGGSTWTVDDDVSSSIMSLYSISVPYTNFGVTAGLGGAYAIMEEGGGDDDDTGTVVLTPAHRDFSLYPNPNKGTFTLTWNDHGPTSVTVANLLGQTIYHTRASGNTHEIKLDIPKGVYFVKVQAGEAFYVERVVVTE